MNKNFRPVSVPLITVDPFFSVWSFADKLTDDVTRHWTGRRNPMTGIIRIDDRAFFFMGKMVYSNRHYNEKFPTIPQTSVKVTPTSSIYTFENELLKLTLKFTTPLLLDDMKLLSRPASYISYDVEVKAAGEHKVALYFDFGTELCTETTEQKVKFGRTDYSFYMGNTEQAPLNRSGDDSHIDWGFFHVCRTDAFISNFRRRRIFCENNPMVPGMKEEDEYSFEQSASIGFITEKLNDVIVVAYDDVHSINYFGDILDAWCMKEYGCFDNAVRAAIADSAETFARCEKFDKEFTARLEKYGEDYAKVAALTYRQAIAAHKLVRGKNDEVLFFSKECFSNGCIATLDITYPSAPLFLIFNPELVKGMLRPIVRQAEDPAWPHDFAPHDAGTYPLATGQTYCRKPDDPYPLDGQMPVEECGNFLLCVAAVCRAEGNDSFAKENAGLMKKWADYLAENGYNPELVKGMLRPIVRQAEDPAWPHDFAPHDAGTYPLATGQTYCRKPDDPYPLDGQMPVEECGNFLLCVAAVCRAEGNDSFAKENAGLMKKWADYLAENGYNPENQLCTDDFAGHLAHNCNLSLKAIAALAAYGKLVNDAKYVDIAHDMAKKFLVDAAGEKASKLTFDGAPDTWSMKYNLVWDRLLDLGLFSDDFYKKEIALYKEKANRFGVPLDNRAMYTKIDWLAWTTILTDDDAYTADIYARCADMVSTSRQRVPVTDWYFTDTADQAGFQNRSVLGGFYINLLKDEWLSK